MQGLVVGVSIQVRFDSDFVLTSCNRVNDAAALGRDTAHDDDLDYTPMLVQSMFILRQFTNGS